MNALKWMHHSAICMIALGLMGPVSAEETVVKPSPAFRNNDRVLFQGDSITDMNRGRGADPNHILGHSYVFMIAGEIGARYPERQLTFINRGISGNTVSDLAKRWLSDTIELKPTLLSILIGVNDLNNNVSAERYEQQYDQLLAETVKALPDVRLVLGEPFGLPSGNKREGWDAYHAELVKRQAVLARLAKKYNAVLVQFQGVFDEATKRAPADYWIWDGVHPTYAGQRLLADEWLRAVNERWKH